MEPPALLTEPERTAWRLVPVDRYGEEGVAGFRSYLSSVAAARAADLDRPLPVAAVSSDDCCGDPLPG